MHMRDSIKSIAAGLASGVITFVVSTLATGYLPAPRQIPYALWELVVLLGIGSALVAFAIHFFSIRKLAAGVVLAYVGFTLTVSLIMGLSGLLAFFYKTFFAWLIGALAASVIVWWLRPNNSFKPNPLRGSA
jgi:hypothetical protein